MWGTTGRILRELLDALFPETALPTEDRVSYETLLVEDRDGVATLTLNRPDARNALNQTVIRELGAALAALDGDPEARVVVIRGAGERAFCAGADLTRHVPDGIDPRGARAVRGPGARARDDPPDAGAR